jgi:hypothetical protein
MIHDRGDFGVVECPKDWAQSRFKFGQKVRYNSENTGVVTGLMYVTPDSYWYETGSELGWYVEISFDRDSPLWRVQRQSICHESEIQPCQQLTGVSYAELIAV